MHKFFFRLSLMPYFCSTAYCCSTCQYVCAIFYVSTHVIPPLHQHCCSCRWVEAVQEPGQAKNWWTPGQARWTPSCTSFSSLGLQSELVESLIQQKAGLASSLTLQFFYQISQVKQYLFWPHGCGIWCKGWREGWRGQWEPASLGTSQSRTAEERGKGAALFCSFSPLERTGAMIKCILW